MSVGVPPRRSLLIVDDAGSKRYVCSDTDYCRQRAECLEENVQ